MKKYPVALKLNLSAIRQLAEADPLSGSNSIYTSRGDYLYCNFGHGIIDQNYIILTLHKCKKSCVDTIAQEEGELPFRELE